MKNRSRKRKCGWRRKEGRGEIRMEVGIGGRTELVSGESRVDECFRKEKNYWEGERREVDDRGERKRSKRRRETRGQKASLRKEVKEGAGKWREEGRGKRRLERTKFRRKEN